MKLGELYENLLLIENYNGKLNKLKTEFPDQAADIDARVTWAKQVFNDRNQAMMWYISLYEAWIKQNIEPTAKTRYETMLGGFPAINNFAQFEEHLNHWLASNYATANQITQVVSRINAQTTTVQALIHNLTTAENSIIQANEKAANKQTPIEILEGDHIVLPLGSQGDWWLLPTNKHLPESSAMGHCGTCNVRSNNMLSLRDKVPRPHLTFEWDPQTHELYQMKGPKNSKPSKQYHHAILALLLSDIVTGLQNKSYQPSSDFSIFDMAPAMVQTVAEQKPKLIIDQINKYPIVFLNAPDFIRANPEFRQAAIATLPGIAAIVQDTGVVDQSTKAWETALAHDPSVVIYAPPTIKNYKQLVANALINDNELMNYCPSKLLGDYDIMSQVIKHSPYNIESVPFGAPTYKQLALLAVQQNEHTIMYVNTDNMNDADLKDIWGANPELIFRDNFPVQLFNKNDLKSQYRSAVKRAYNKVTDIAPGVFDNEELKELWRFALKTPSIHVLKKLPKDLFDTNELQEITRKILNSKKYASIGFEHLDLSIMPADELARICSTALKKNPELIQKMTQVPLKDILTPKELADAWTHAFKDGLEKHQTAWMAMKELPKDTFTPKDMAKLVLPYFNSTDDRMLYSVPLADLVGSDIATEHWKKMIENNPMMAFKLFINLYGNQAYKGIDITPEELEPIVADYINAHLTDPEVVRERSGFSQIIHTRLPEVLKNMIAANPNRNILDTMNPNDLTFDVCELAIKTNPKNITDISPPVRKKLGDEAVEYFKSLVPPEYRDMMYENDYEYDDYEYDED